jgi:hypothetical protein
MKARVRSVAGRLARPLTFRFAQLQERADHTEQLTTTAVQRTEEVQNGLWGLATRVDEIGGRLEMVFDQLDADMQVMGEFARITERLTRRLAAHADDVADRARRVEEGSERLERAAEGKVAGEQVVLAFVYGALAGLPAGSRVLVWDDAATPVGLGLAGTGHRVTVLDRRPYPYTHPGLEVLGGDGEPGPAPGEQYAAVVCLHGHAPAADAPTGAELATLLGRLAPHVAGGGTLVVAAPAGADAGAPGGPLDGWDLLDRREYGRDAGGSWLPAPAPAAPGSGLTLVVARRP